MDKAVQETRLISWANVVSACQSRPKGISQETWIKENGMTPNQYYYWQRKVRKAAYLKQHSAPPEDAPNNTSSVAFVELSPDMENHKGSAPVPTPSGFHADAVIRTGRSEIGIANSISPELFHRIMEEIRHAE
jgi:hypothetical protein